MGDSRIEALLQVEDASAADVSPPAEELGAESGVAYRWPDGVLATVYEFASYDAANAARSLVEADDTSVNGGLLLAVSAPEGTSQFRVLEIVSRFAGKE
jgi:hypothetical protein